MGTFSQPLHEAFLCLLPVPVALLCATVLCTAVPAATEPSGTLVLYVAPNGSDDWSGRLRLPNPRRTDGPLATLQGARDAIRRIRTRNDAPQHIVVKVEAGTYSLKEPFTLNSQDGEPQGSVVYEGEGTHPPVLSGGRRITGWKKGTNGVWTAEIPEVRAGTWYFQSLWVNGERRPRARTPNEGYLHAAARAPQGFDPRSAFIFRDEDIKNWPDLEDVNVIMFHNWEASRHRIQSVDATHHLVQLTGPAPWPLLEATDRYIVENAPDALDAPGEWYLNRHTGTLSYIPKPGEDMHKAVVVAPILTQLVRIEGNPAQGEFVQNVTLRNLAFEYCDWVLPHEGYADPQAAVSIPPAVEVNGARSVGLELLEVSHVGGYGVGFLHACRDCALIQTYIHDLGAGGVKLGETSLPQQEDLRTESCRVENNFIHDGGNVYPSGCGILALQTSYNTIRHNEISDFYYTGVSVGWSWGYAPSSAHHNLVADNHIHHIGFAVLSDMGGIYTLGVAPGTILRHNKIHDVESFSYGGWGIYPDEGSTTLTIEDNVVYNCKSACFHQHYGRDNLIRNNIWAFGREFQLMRTRNEDHRSFTFEHNIVYYTQGDLLGSNWQGGPDKFSMDYNVYWNAAGKPVTFQGASLAAWQARGLDRHSVVADPLFVNAEAYDFRLKPTSPALALGFKPIRMNGFGLEGPKNWVTLPLRVRNRPWVVPKPQPPQPIAEDLDQLPVGSAPLDLRIYGEENGASIRVAPRPDGLQGHCLKFTDAPGLRNAYDPHAFYLPDYSEGTARFAFDLWFEPSAEMFVEWRNNASPYAVGPSLYLHPDGRLTANGRDLLDVPPRHWIHVEETCGLGSRASGQWTLKLQLEGRPPRIFTDLPCSKAFRTLDWLGFSSMATDTRVFYVNNIRLTLLPAGPKNSFEGRRDGTREPENS
ncbi:MAG: right-handed parallel beta-helix repeat-containing protein [Chthonomonadales bacterium]